ncbi:MAG TPA: hypothetical protein VFV51_02990, partial [Vicinamibacterales bacterium]|nr:hypothetical protein [Vicinamibacterales bacterium]
MIGSFSSLDHGNRCVIAATAVAAAPRAIDAAICRRDFSCSGLRFRVAAARAETFFRAAFGCARFADLRFCVLAFFAFFAVRLAGLLVVFRAFDFVARLRVGDFFAKDPPNFAQHDRHADINASSTGQSGS